MRSCKNGVSDLPEKFQFDKNRKLGITQPLFLPLPLSKKVTSITFVLNRKVTKFVAGNKKAEWIMTRIAQPFLSRKLLIVIIGLGIECVCVWGDGSQGLMHTLSMNFFTVLCPLSQH